MLYRKFLLHFALLLIGTAPAFPAVEICNEGNNPSVPTSIDYTLNCPADVTIEILPCTLAGTPTGPAVRTVTFIGQSKGFHRYIWLGDKDGGGTPPNGYYIPRVTATANQPGWGPISGLYLNNDWTHEYAPRPLPAVPDVEGFYGIGINKNPGSAYYGRIYVSHKTQKDVYMYGPDGTPLGAMNDSAVTWGASAPWDLAVADDGYIYVSDRSTMRIHCFSPAGNYVSTSPTITFVRALFARTTSDGRTHVYVSGDSAGVKKIIVEPDHVTWTPPITTVYNTGGGDGMDAYGMWVSPDLLTIYQACISGPSTGLTRWLKQYNGNYTKDSGFNCAGGIGACVDVDYVDAPGTNDYLWVTKMAAYANDDPGTTQNEYSRALYKVSLSACTATGEPYDVVSWGCMVAADAVGNPAVTFGKLTTTWGQRYWGLFAEAGVSTSQKLLDVITGPPPDGCPLIVPDSVVWAPDNTIAADNTDTASVSFKAMDPNGWNDISSPIMNLAPIGYGTQVGSVAQDPSDPTGRTAIITFSGIKAKPGARCTTSYGQPPHYLTASVCDSTGCCASTDDDIQLQVSGSMVNGHIGHSRVAGWNMQGAQIQAVGGGIPGATDPRAQGPFTYCSAPSSAGGNASIEVSAGVFQVKATKTGFGSQAPVYIGVPYGGGTLSLYLRPLTVAEARETANGTKINVEGVCFAQPVGYNCLGMIEAYGLAPRTDTLIARNQWYVCDPNDPANGILCLITKPSATFIPQWDCPTDFDDFGMLTYIGKRPAQGETIMVTATIDTPGGHERRVLLGNSDLESGLADGTIARTYLNRGDLGGYPSAPIVVPLSQVGHSGTTAFSPTWGKYVRVNNVTVISVNMVGDDNPSGEPVPYATVVDMLGNSAEIVMQTPQTLGMSGPGLPNCFPSIGCTYDIRGAAGRRNRYGNGCIRVRGCSDFIAIPGCVGPGSDLSTVRGMPTGSYVELNGIVTAKVGSNLWIESPDRTVGIRVMLNPSHVAVGDGITVAGTLVMNDGERVIQPTKPIIPRSVGNPVPAPFDLRTREIGGGPCLTEPGVSTGRGAYNVGLRVHVQGMVTACDSSANPTWYYIWDGANRSDMPVSDGTGNIGIRIEGAPPSGSMPWQTWVDTTGVVSTDASLVPGTVAPTIVPTAASKVTAFDTISTPADKPFKSGWNLVGVPAVPAETGDGDEWSAKPWDPYVVLPPTHDPSLLDGRLSRWENCTGSLVLYDSWNEWSEVGAHGPFGGTLLGDGYWLQIDEDWPVSYSGKAGALDQWIGICEPGWMIIGHPKDHDTLLADVKVHDGGAIYSMYDAVMTNAWIDCVGYWWDNVGQGLVDIGIPDCWATSDTLMPWHGYWLQVYRGNLALIVPEAPAAP